MIAVQTLELDFDMMKSHNFKYYISYEDSHFGLRIPNKSSSGGNAMLTLERFVCNEYIHHIYNYNIMQFYMLLSF